MNRRTAAALAAVAAACSTAAEANSGIGFFIHATPAIVLALPVAIVVEAPVLARGLGMPLGRALGLSGAANLVSTLVGVLLALALDIALLAPFGSSGASGGRGVMLAALLPMFFITWGVEAWFLRSRLKDRSLRVGLWAFAANVVSYALIAAGVWAWAPPYEGSPRERITEVMMEMGLARMEVSEEFTTKGRFGPARELKPKATMLERLRVEADGRVVARLASGREEALAGKSITLAPRIEAGSIVEWQCTSTAPAKYLPANCR